MRSGGQRIRRVSIKPNKDERVYRIRLFPLNEKPINTVLKSALHVRVHKGEKPFTSYLKWLEKNSDLTETDCNTLINRIRDKHGLNSLMKWVARTWLTDDVKTESPLSSWRQSSPMDTISFHPERTRFRRGEGHGVMVGFSNWSHDTLYQNVYGTFNVSGGTFELTREKTHRVLGPLLVWNGQQVWDAATPVFSRDRTVRVFERAVTEASDPIRCQQEDDMDICEAPVYRMSKNDVRADVDVFKKRVMFVEDRSGVISLVMSESATVSDMADQAMAMSAHCATALVDASTFDIKVDGKPSFDAVFRVEKM